MANAVTDSRKVPGSAPPQPPTTASTPSEAIAAPTKTVQRWLCDCCKIARFEHLADACAHEEECLIITVQEKLKQTREAPEAPVASTTVEAEDPVPAAKVETATVEAKAPVAATAATSKPKPEASFFQKGTKRRTNESTSNQLIRLLESVERRLIVLPDAASSDTSVQSAADLARRLVEIAFELNKLPIPPLQFMPDSDAAPVPLSNSASRQRILLQGLETNMALEFELDDHNVGEVFRWDQNDDNTTRRADALGILGRSSDDVLPRLEISLLPREHSTSSNGTVLVRGPPLGYCARNTMRIFGTLLAVGLTLYVMNSLSCDSAYGSRNLPAPVERYHKLWQCAAKLSGNVKLVQDSPQARAVEWFVTDTGRGMDMPSHCSWDSDFATLYALIVIRESLAVQDASWRSSNGNGNTEVTSLKQVCRDWTRIQCNERGQLSGLILADANLVGKLPAELSILQHLTTLQVHSNPGVTGSLPAELSRLTRLDVFMLQQTHLAGTIPSQWGRMTNLQQLLLDDTLLTGTVPIEICRLRKEHALDSLHANCRGDHALIKCSCCTLCK